MAMVRGAILAILIPLLADEIRKFSDKGGFELSIATSLLKINLILAAMVLVVTIRRENLDQLHNVDFDLVENFRRLALQ
jgi:hypothetical protein